MKIGAWCKEDKSCEFTVWAPSRKSVAVKLASQTEMCVELEKEDHGYWVGSVQNVLPGEKYTLVIDGTLERPDPASFFQPEGVHKPSGIVDHMSYSWKDDQWTCMPLEEMVMYELHVGAFTEEGTFEGISQKIDYLKKLGVNAIEIMPVAQFPGDRNWGYDGVHPFAVQNSYGGPHGLKRLVDQCHQNGIAVILDVVYNHLGPEGNYLADFGPYFTQKYQTPWGWAINFDDKGNEGVRNYFLQNALYWLEYFHIDALRLDAIHGIFDFSAKHILKEMAQEVKEYAHLKNKKHYLIAESDLNDSRIVASEEKAGYGIDAQWLDDFHHSFRAMITGENKGYYCDFGKMEQCAKAYKDGFVYDGNYSKYRKKKFGNSSKHLEPKKFVAFIQNHDQVGNSMLGERLSHLVDFESLKLAAGVMIFSPYIPMLFMGEEFAADTPFLYFISHLDTNLVKAVEDGRKKEFSQFSWEGEPPSPFSKETYLQTKMKWDCLEQAQHAVMFDFYCKLIYLRKENIALNKMTRACLEVSYDEEKKTMAMGWAFEESSVYCYINFSDEKNVFSQEHTVNTGFQKVIDSADKKWNGPGSLSEDTLSPQGSVSMQPRSFIVFKK